MQGSIAKEPTKERKSNTKKHSKQEKFIKRHKKKKKNQMGHIENEYQDGRLKLNYNNNYIKYKWTKCSNEKAEIFRME